MRRNYVKRGTPLVAVKGDHEVLQNGMMLVLSSGTAVKLERVPGT